MFGGTFLGATIAGRILATVIITSVWVLGTYRGFQPMRAPAACPVPAQKRTPRRRAEPVAD